MYVFNFSGNHWLYDFVFTQYVRAYETSSHCLID